MEDMAPLHEALSELKRKLVLEALATCHGNRSRAAVLGYLFGAVEDKVEKTELVLLITPRVVGTARDAARITEEMRAATPELEESIRRGGRRAPSPASPSAAPPR